MRRALAAIRTVPPRYQLAAALTGLVLAGLAAYAVIIAPMRARAAELELQFTALQAEVTQGRAAIIDLMRYRRETVELEKRLDLVKSKLPTEREIPPLYRTLYDTAARSGLGVALFQPRDVRIHDYYTEIPIAVTAEGTYHQLGRLFERVAELPRVVTVGDLKLTSLARPKTSVKAEMTLSTYVYRPVGSPPVPKLGAAKPGATPGRPPESNGKKPELPRT